MGLDIRLPIGVLFSVFGLILILFGAISSREIYQRSLDININLIWGLVLLAFGSGMLLLGRRGMARSAEKTTDLPAETEAKQDAAHK